MEIVFVSAARMHAVANAVCCQRRLLRCRIAPWGSPKSHQGGLARSGRSAGFPELARVVTSFFRGRHTRTAVRSDERMHMPHLVLGRPEFGSGAGQCAYLAPLVKRNTPPTDTKQG